jgi:microcin C transport system substrate-binding protein
LALFIDLILDFAAILLSFKGMISRSFQKICERVQKATLCSAAIMVFLIASGLTPAVHATEKQQWRHAISLTGEPKYPAGFKHTDYVNVQAPKAGRVRLGASGTFDNFNPLISGVKGNLAAYLMMIYEPLLWGSLDEQTTEYGLLAQAVAFPADYSSVSYRLRPEARWHDGRPVTVEDVIFSFYAWKKHSPQFNRTLLKVTGVEKVSSHEVKFTFSEKGDASLPLYVGQMSILPKHWWTGKDSEGRDRDIATTTLELPLGSGPYRLKAFVPGRSLSYEQVPDYWGKSVPIRVGTENMNAIQIEYFRDTNVMFEAFKADQIDVRRESSLKSWVVGYDFAAAREKRVVKDAFTIERLGLVKSFVFNQRRAKFQDNRIRKAIALAYGFDDVNRNVFHNMLSRPGSYFPHTDFEAKGNLNKSEQEMLTTLPGAPPAETLGFNSEPNSDVSLRRNLFKALKLLKDAGWALNQGRLVDYKGDQLTVEFLLEDAAMERVASAYADSLGKLGIDVAIRVVDDVQYQNRLRTFDFDIAVHAWVQGHAPGSEQREYWSSDSADKRGTNNIAGLKSPLIDALVEKLVLAPNRAEKIAAGRLLDRVLRTTTIGVPIMTEDKELVARWDRFGRPAAMPQYGATAFPTIWWWDEAKAKMITGK